LGIDFSEEILTYKNSHVLFRLRYSDAGQHDSLKILSILLVEKAINSFIHNGEYFKTHQRAIGSFCTDAFANYAFISLSGQVQKEHGANKYYKEGAIICLVL
jgi:hypothetical protein